MCAIVVHCFFRRVTVASGKIDVVVAVFDRIAWCQSIFHHCLRLFTLLRRCVTPFPPNGSYERDLQRENAHTHTQYSSKHFVWRRTKLVWNRWNGPKPNDECWLNGCLLLLPRNKKKYMCVRSYPLSFNWWNRWRFAFHHSSAPILMAGSVWQLFCGHSAIHWVGTRREHLWHFSWRFIFGFWIGNYSAAGIFAFLFFIDSKNVWILCCERNDGKGASKQMNVWYTHCLWQRSRSFAALNAIMKFRANCQMWHMILLKLIGNKK